MDTENILEKQRWRAKDGVDSEETTPLLQTSIGRCSLPKEERVRVYWWRWVVLFIFVLALAVNNSLWITFGPIADVVRCYYKVSNFWVNSLSMIYMFTYIIFLVPSSWSLARLGMRTTAVIAVILNAIGAGIRLARTGEYDRTCLDLLSSWIRGDKHKP